jgi:hypothetical protein
MDLRDIRFGVWFGFIWLKTYLQIYFESLFPLAELLNGGLVKS